MRRCSLISTLMLLSLASLLVANCSKKKEVITMPEPLESDSEYDLSSIGKATLSEYGFFKQPLAELKPSANVIPYDLNSSLFTDYALKQRFMYVPEGTLVEYREHEVLDFPVGTVLIKNFYYSTDQLENAKGGIIETRLLIHEADGWTALPYVWNEEQTEAFLEITGSAKQIQLKGRRTFTYKVPTLSECRSCHERSGMITPIGPSVRQLNKTYPYASGEMNQLTKMVALQWLNIPDPDALAKIADWSESSVGHLDERARAYLDINCGHCHSSDGPAKTSGLDLTVFNADRHALGINKRPVAAGKGSGGLQHDIVPGEPDASILLYRMKSNDAAVKMPEMGRSIVHEEGVQLIAEWIEEMDN